MPCYNGAEFIRNSVYGILRQSFTDLELIVVDDASRDKSAAIVRELEAEDPRVRLICHTSNHGASRSRNDGIRAATGEFLGFCDADDIWKPDKLKRQIALLVDNPSCDVTYSDSEIIDESGHPTGDRFSTLFPIKGNPSGNIFENLCVTNFINTQTVLMRRHSIPEEHLFFDERLKWVEDWWQWILLSRKHLFLYESDPLAMYRVHRQSTRITQKLGISVNRWRVCKRILRGFPDMPDRLKAEIWYQMGMGLSQIGWHRTAGRFYGKAVQLGFGAGLSIRRLLTMCVRFGTQSLGSALGST
jgi:teichuronic acid biosynthesis glycosyltransferase TuaG